MKIKDLIPGMVVRFPEDGFKDDKAKVIRIDHEEKRVHFHDIEEDFDFDADFEEVELIVKPV